MSTINRNIRVHLLKHMKNGNSTNSENPASISGGFRFGGCGAFRFFLDFFRFFEINSLNQDKSDNYFQ